MAQLAIAAAGAAIGNIWGYAAIGWMIGSVIGTMLFPPSVPDTFYEGPRLGDLSVSSSAYGAFINRGWGTHRVNGNMIWTSGIEEVKNTTTTSVSGGKGGGGGDSTQTTVTYEYFASFAIGIMEGPIDDIHRIWADGKLIYDVSLITWEEDPDPPNVNGFFIKTAIEILGDQSTSTTSSATSKPGVNFRLYPGSETQLPDSIIEAQEGIGEVPAFRGLAYVVFEKLPLADFGNRIPNLTFEITKGTASVAPLVQGDVFSGFQAGSPFAVDYNRNLVYRVFGDQLSVMDLTTMSEIRRISGTDMGAYDTLNDVHVLPNGDLLIDYWYTGNDIAYEVYDADSLMVKSTQFFSSYAFYISKIQTTQTQTSIGNPQFALSRNAPWGGMGMVCLTDGAIFFDTNNGIAPPWTGKTMVGVTQGPQIGNVSELWVMVGEYSGFGGDSEEYTPTETIELWIVTIKTTVEVGISGDPFYTHRVTGRKHDEWQADSVVAAEIGQSRKYGHTYSINRIADTNSIVWSCQTHDQTGEVDNPKAYLMRYDLDSKTFDYQLNNSDIIAILDQAVVTDNKVGGISGSYAYSYDLIDGSLINKDYLGLGLDPWISDFFYDGTTHSVIYSDTLNQNDMRRVLLDRANTVGALLSDIVTDICASDGIPSSDIDVSELTSITVHGYVQSRLTSGRDLLVPLSQFFMFDVIESDYKLVFKLRGAASVRTLTEVDIVGQGNHDDYVIETITQEAEMPKTLDLTYIDHGQDYQQNTQRASRNANAVNTVSTLDMSVAIATDATTAKQTAENLLRTAWNERSAYKVNALWKHIDLDPADVVDVSVGSVNYKMRILSASIGDNLTIELETAGEDAASYSSTSTGDSGSGVPRQYIPGVTISTLILMNTPLLRDLDDDGRAITKVYSAVGSYSDDFNNSSLYFSQDGETYTRVHTFINDAPWGHTTTALPDTTVPDQTDEVTVLTVRILNRGEELESITQEQMLNGGNPAAVIRSNGNVEIIQFRDVVDNGDGTYDLSGLVRGRRGTEVFAKNHAIGDMFVLLSVDYTNPVTQELSAVGSARYFKNVPTGALFEDINSKPNTSPGNDLKPYAVVHHKAVQNGSDIDITWERRTRVGGAWKDATGSVPLSEDTEEYEIDFLDEPGGSVTFQVAGITTPAYTLLSADIDTYIEQAVTLANPGAEDGVNNWTYTSGFTTSATSPHSGANVFSMGGAQVALCDAYQDFAISASYYDEVDAGNIAVDLEWWQRNDNSDVTDTGYMEIEAFDASMISLGSSAATADAVGSTWTQRSLAYVLPANTRTVRLTMYGVRVTGSYINVYFDDILAKLDINGMPPTLTMNIYQISAQVGRGFVTETTVEVE